MLKIRLRRMGATHSPFYRVVVSDSRKTPRSAVIDEIGYYNPTRKPAVISVDTDKVDHWVARGAQLSPTVKKVVEQAAATQVVES